MSESKIICPTCKQKLDFEYCSNSLHLFPDIRSFTEEEAKDYGDALKKLGTPTGKNMFDLMSGEPKET